MKKPTLTSGSRRVKFRQHTRHYNVEWHRKPFASFAHELSIKFCDRCSGSRVDRSRLDYKAQGSRDIACKMSVYTVGCKVCVHCTLYGVAQVYVHITHADKIDASISICLSCAFAT
jgi:hypothetical protein